MNEDVKSENVRIHSRADELIACLEGEIAKRDEELAACRVAVENCEAFRARIAELEEENENLAAAVRVSQQTAVAVSKELRAELAAIKAQEPVLPCELDLESSFSCAEKEASLHAGVRDTFYFALIECLQKNKLYRAPAQKELSVVMPERKKAHNCEGIEFWKANGWNDCLDELASIYAAPVSEAKAQGVVMPERAVIREVFMRNGFTIKEGQDDLKPYVYAAAEELLRLAAPAAPAADAGLVAVEWAKDAEEWGPALNEAGWLFLSELNEDPQKSALIFNNCKGPLRAAIMKYAEIVASHRAKGVV